MYRHLPLHVGQHILLSQVYHFTRFDKTIWSEKMNLWTSATHLACASEWYPWLIVLQDSHQIQWLLLSTFELHSPRKIDRCDQPSLFWAKEFSKWEIPSQQGCWVAAEFILQNCWGISLLTGNNTLEQKLRLNLYNTIFSSHHCLGSKGNNLIVSLKI
jgi:hypothetical protein